MARIVKSIFLILLFVALWDDVVILKLIATFILVFKGLGIIING